MPFIRLLVWALQKLRHLCMIQEFGFSSSQNLLGQKKREIFYMFRPDNTSDHMQQGLMTLHHIISLQQ